MIEATDVELLNPVPRYQPVAGEPRRVRTLCIAREFLEDVVRGGTRPVIGDAPADLIVLAMQADSWEPWYLRLLVGSAAFDPVPDGERPPEVLFTYRRVMDADGD